MSEKKQGLLARKPAQEDWEESAPQQESWEEGAPTEYWEEQPPEEATQEKSFLQNLPRTTLEALPMAGAMAGGIIGLGAGPAGAMGGAAAGGYAGKSLEQMGKQYLLGDEPAENPNIESAKEGLELGLGEGAGGLLVRGASRALQAGGKKIYKSGLKAADVVLEKMGKKPLSDILMQKGISGNAEQIASKASDLADEFLVERDALLKEGRKKGIEVSMKDSMAGARNKIAELRSTGNPDNLQIANAFEKRIRAIERLDARPSVPVVRDLPVQSRYTTGDVIKSTPQEKELIVLPKQAKYTTGEVISSTPTEPGILELPVGQNQWEFPKIGRKPEVAADILPPKVEYGPKGYIPQEEAAFMPREDIVEYGPRGYIQNPPQKVYDMTEARPGVDVKGATKLKTSLRKSIPGTKFGQSAQTSEGQGLMKKMSAGVQKETEKAMQKGMGTGDQLAELNDKIGRILSSDKKLTSEAAKEELANLIKGFDIPIGIMSPKGLAIKKAIEYGTGTAAKTKGGLLLNKAGQKLSQPGWNRGLIELQKILTNIGEEE